jgi:topoisomerase IA-like protein
MVVISSSQLKKNTMKYLHIAKEETVLVEEGNSKFYVFHAKDNLIPYDDIAKSLTADKALEIIYSKIDKLYAHPEMQQ